MKKYFLLFTAFALVGGVVSAAPKNEKAPPKSAALIALGKKAYTANCVTCHGIEGNGKGPAGIYMQPHPRDFITDQFKAGDKPSQVFNTISNGLSGTAMVSFQHLPERTRWGLAYYVLSFRKGTAKK